MREKQRRQHPDIKKNLLLVMAGLFLLITVCAFVITVQTLTNTEGSIKEKFTALHETAESEISGRLFLRTPALEYSGLFSRLAGMRSAEKIVKLQNGQLTGESGEPDPAPSAEKVAGLSEFCRANDTPFLYINLPQKPLSDSDLTKIGVEAHINQTQDTFLKLLTDAGVSCLDLRSPIREHYSDPYDSFYRTDHHWTAEAGLFAAGVIADRIQELCGLPADTYRLDPENYKTTRYKNCFLGEIGLKTGAVFADPEDFLVVEPEFPTHLTFTVPSRKIDASGDFSILLNKSKLENHSVYDSGLYYTYLYGNDPIQQIHNEDAAGGRILIVKDSFGQMVVPYLAMNVRDLTCWDVRANKVRLRDHLKENDYDLVIVMYTGSMIKRTELMYPFD